MHDKLLRGQFGCAVEVHGVDRLVGRQCNDRPHAGIDCRVDDVLRPGDVGLHRLERVVLRGDHLLHRGGMDDDVGSLRSAQQPLRVTDITDEVAEPIAVETLLHLGLLEFVAEKIRIVQSGNSVRIRPTKALPNDPVPPVRRMVEPLSVISVFLL